MLPSGASGNTLINMLPEMLLHGRPITSVFELLGRSENDITYSIGWALTQSDAFLHEFLRRVIPGDRQNVVERIALQTRGADGITDMEITGPEFHIIAEAKRGWHVPREGQFRRYLSHFERSGRPIQRLVSLSECSDLYARTCLPPSINKVPIVHLGWRDIDAMTRVGRTHAEKRLLSELRLYLSRMFRMQDQQSNLVYVVALSNSKPPRSQHSYIEIVEELGRYYHPIGVSRWPKRPPNYLGFRYRGRLQRIHHVEDVRVVTDINKEVPELKRKPWSIPHYVYTLGPAIVPSKTVRTGKIFRSGRVWAMLDLLLTSDSIAEARDSTNARQEH
jgi:hypothetical protein